MYIDGVIVYGVLIVVLTCLFLGYLTYYFLRHIKEDVRKAQAQDANQGGRDT